MVRALEEGPSSSPGLTASWICSRYRVQILGHACKCQLMVCLRPVGILNPVKFNLNCLFQGFAWPH